MLISVPLLIPWRLDDGLSQRSSAEMSRGLLSKPPGGPPRPHILLTNLLPSSPWSPESELTAQPVRTWPPLCPNP